MIEMDSDFYERYGEKPQRRPAPAPRAGCETFQAREHAVRFLEALGPDVNGRVFRMEDSEKWACSWRRK